MSFKSRCFVLADSGFCACFGGGIMALVEKPDTKEPDTKEKVSVGGYSFWQFGQIVKGWDRSMQILSIINGRTTCLSG